MKKKILILSVFIFVLASCGKGSSSSTYSRYSSYFSSSSKVTPTYTAHDIVSYLERNGTEEDSGSYYVDIVSGNNYYTLAATPGTLSFKLQAIRTAVSDGLSGGLVIYHTFTWGSITSGYYNSGLVVSNGTNQGVIPFGISVKSYDDDYGIESFSYKYSSSYGLSKDTFEGLVSTTIDIYNYALTNWNNKLKRLGYPTLK